MTQHNSRPETRPSAKNRPDGRSSSFLEEFGAHLLLARAIDELALQRSQRAARQSGERFDRVLTKLGLISEADLTGHLGRFLDVAIIAAEDLPETPILAELIPEKFIRTNGILPLFVKDGSLVVAVADPLDAEAVDALAYLTGLEPDLRTRNASASRKGDIWSLWQRPPGRFPCGWRHTG